MLIVGTFTKAFVVTVISLTEWNLIETRVVMFFMSEMSKKSEKQTNKEGFYEFPWGKDDTFLMFGNGI